MFRSVQVVAVKQMQTHRKRDNKSDWQGQIPRSVGTDRACFGRLCCLGYTTQLRSMFTANDTKPAHTQAVIRVIHSILNTQMLYKNVLVISVKFAWKAAQWLQMTLLWFTIKRIRGRKGEP